VFWKKKDTKYKVKELTQREIFVKKIVEEVEALTEGQAVIYQLPEFYTFARFLGVELNPAFPQKGKKYLMFTDQMAEGKPTGKRSYIASTNKASEYADGVVERDGDKWGHVTRFQ
jgi:hypothetical protein